MHDIETYHGPNEKPTWAPSLDDVEYVNPVTSHDNVQDLFHLNSVVVPNAIHPWVCESLIEQFEQQQKYPVGVSGYAEDTNIGSYRAMAWSPRLADELFPAFNVLPSFFRGNGPDLNSDIAMKRMQRIPASFDTRDKDYELLGSTPWFRFMKYESGGEHVPHYDAPFHNEEEHYITLFSWVLYLNYVPEDAGGHFQFVDDGYMNHPQYRTAGWNADWTHQAEENQILESVRPMQGTLVIFPHWLCHQVQHFEGPVRYIVRGDIAYSY